MPGRQQRQTRHTIFLSFFFSRARGKWEKEEHLDWIVLYTNLFIIIIIVVSCTLNYLGKKKKMKKSWPHLMRKAFFLCGALPAWPIKK